MSQPGSAQSQPMSSTGIGAQQLGPSLTVGSATPDGGNKWAAYFGPASSAIKTNAYDKYAYETYDLPEAYKGKNLFLRDTIDGFILEDNEWYTRACLPYAQTNDIHLAWSVLLHQFSVDNVMFFEYLLF